MSGKKTRLTKEIFEIGLKTFSFSSNNTNINHQKSQIYGKLLSFDEFCHTKSCKKRTSSLELSKFYLDCRQHAEFHEDFRVNRAEVTSVIEPSLLDNTYCTLNSSYKRYMFQVWLKFFHWYFTKEIFTFDFFSRLFFRVLTLHFSVVDL